MQKIETIFHKRNYANVNKKILIDCGIKILAAIAIIVALFALHY